jgi:antitoxin component HigA of HigAB toxin-antitoxin module
MKRWQKSVLATALVMGLAIPAGVHAAETQAQPAAKLTQAGQVGVQHERQGEHPKTKWHRGMHLNAHRQMYLTLLAEKYTPDSVDEWKAAFAERERLMTELKAVREQNGKDEQNQKLREEWKALSEKLHEQVKNGEITREQMKQQLKEWRDKNFGERNPKDAEAMRAVMEQFKQTHEAFDAAIQSGDAEKIKEVLPKLLDEVKTVNQHLAKKLEQKKN